MRATGGMLCPRRALAKCFELTPAEPESPAFLWKSRCRTVPMTHGVFVGEVKKLIRRIGLDPSQYSGHSFRRGGATVAFNLGVDHLSIKLQRDWVSNAYQRYEQLTEARRLELPKRLAARMKQVESKWKCIAILPAQLYCATSAIGDTQAAYVRWSMSAAEGWIADMTNGAASFAEVDESDPILPLLPGASPPSSATEKYAYSSGSAASSSTGLQEQVLHDWRVLAK
ncbi:hypothetical protein CYMTET_26627 [Cymbomonas tetramitiformis]|uniref:Tyr recombinase domain-containing protein n=1 Tax=Cymbomonas tetramitiformis TaxID=36881 RepID=A0AAE0KXZ0_9CHLO|nr:hypothetical protein CYMTET_26627 [Cymbomonas tetramitiformis]